MNANSRSKYRTYELKLQVGNASVGDTGLQEEQKAKRGRRGRDRGPIR